MKSKRIERRWRQKGLQVPPQRLKSSEQKAIGDRRPRDTRPSRGSRRPRHASALLTPWPINRTNRSCFSVIPRPG